jgi:hypothetical protein
LLARLGAIQEGVDGAEEGFLVALREFVDGLEAAKKAAVEWDAVFTARLETEELVDGDLESASELNEHLRMRPKFAALVVAENGLDDAGLGSELDLSEAALLTEPSDALTESSIDLSLGVGSTLPCHGGTECRGG